MKTKPYPKRAVSKLPQDYTIVGWGSNGNLFSQGKKCLTWDTSSRNPVWTSRIAKGNAAIWIYALESNDPYFSKVKKTIPVAKRTALAQKVAAMEKKNAELTKENRELKAKLGRFKDEIVCCLEKLEQA